MSDLASAIRRRVENEKRRDILDACPIFLPTSLYEFAVQEYGENPLFEKLERLPQ